jgi:hypothetical protein
VLLEPVHVRNVLGHLAIVASRGSIQEQEHQIKPTPWGWTKKEEKKNREPPSLREKKKKSKKMKEKIKW